MSDEDIVISGMSGRFPLSNNTDEFAKNLYDGIDMVTGDDSRWPSDLYDISPRMGKIQDYDKFDVLFFGLMQQLAEQIDPQSRILLETTYEAIVDAGINPQTMKGSNTGVYIGISHYLMTDGYPEELQPDMRQIKQRNLLQTMGNMKALYANRISYVFDFKGPSLITDTACSASSVAFNLAMNDLRLGNITHAIVGGTHMNFAPFINQTAQEVGLCSPRGISAVLDQSADGFVKGEAVACILLQKRATAKRIYSTVLTSRVNIDGRKTVGMFYPSSESQKQLMVMTYKEANIDPLKVTYFEAHSTGTKVGDPQEVKAIYNAYCDLPKREEQLPLGLLKSNVGHSEAASGVSSLIKVMIAYENECIPMNINLIKVKDECAQYCPPLYPITENYKYTPGIAAVNNFGVGGVNGHIILEPNYKLSNGHNLKIAETIPRIVNICGRTEESIKFVFDFIQNNPQKISRDFLALLSDTMKIAPSMNSAGFPYRGSIIIKKLNEENNELNYEYKKQYSHLFTKTGRPVWFLFPGLGGQWSGMAKSLMSIKIFADKVEECHRILSEFGIDLQYLLTSEDKTTMSSMTNKFCATTAIEIALFELIKQLDITPDGIIGHSFGEIACAYADGCLTTKEALIVTYFRGVVTENDKNIPKGLMAVVGLSKAEAKKLCPKGVYVVCNNAQKTVVLSGLENEMLKLIDTLNERGVFVRQLESSYIPYHSIYLQTSAQEMTDLIKKYVPEPRLRSKKWVSTAVLEAEPADELKYASAEYFVHNLLKPVEFYDKFKELPGDAIVIEISPHSVFGKIVSETLESVSYVSLLKKESNDTNLDYFLQSIAKLYELGLNPDIDKLYPRVEWPVARNTQSIGSLMRWDHSTIFHVPKYPDSFCRSTASDMNVTINITENSQRFYIGHNIDGNVIFPATGYLMFAWRQFAATQGRIWNTMPVHFENVQFRRPIFLSETTPTTIKVRYQENSGEFFILENGNITCTGHILPPSDDLLIAQNVIHESLNKVTEKEFILEKDDIYKELRIMGYDYGKEFRRLAKIRTNNFKQLQGTIEWDGNFFTFLDSMLQSMAFIAPFRKMMVPVMIGSLRIDPKVFFDEISKNRIIEEKESDKIEDIEIDKDVAPEEKFNKVNEEIQYTELEGFKFTQIEHEENINEIVDYTSEALRLLAERFCNYRSVVPFYFDFKSKLLLTYGIELENVIAFPIPRRSDRQQLRVDMHQFVANDDRNAIEPVEMKICQDYLEVCKSMASKLKLNSYRDMKCDFNYKDISDEKIENYRNANNESHILFRILDKIMSSAIDENMNIESNGLNEKRLKMFKDIQNDKELDLSKDLINQVHKNQMFLRTLLDIVSENFVPKKEIKVLEINLFNEVMAKEVDDLLANYQLYPIDIEYKLLVKDKTVVHENYREKANEWDVKTSESVPNLTPNDLIIVRDTQDLYGLNVEKLIQELNDAIIGNGYLLAVFRHKFTEPEMALNSLFAKNVFNEIDLEKRINDFVMTAKNIGFNVICRKSDSISSTAILLRKVTEIPQIPENDHIIGINTKYEDWFEPLKEKLVWAKELDNKTDNVWLIGNESYLNGILGLVNCLRLEPGGENLRCIFDLDNDIKLPIDFKSKPFDQILNNDLVINVLKDRKLGTYRHIRLPKDNEKVVSNEYFLNIQQMRDLSSLQWFDGSKIAANKEVFDLFNNKIKQIHCNIYSSGINFHDVMVATGRIPSGPQLLFTDCLIGTEFAGRRTDTGERVMGFEMTRCFASSIYANEKLTSRIPDHWSMDEAVTILTTYNTAWYALVEKGNLKKGEKVLIHSGAGGVGQSAINICKYYECDIFVTVGTEEKKQFLVKEYNIPEKKIFSSRDIQFKYKIMQMTDGRGVDLVLNSLAGDKLDASYRCVANGGRFLELGKFDLVQNKQLGMFDFLRDVSFIGVAVDICLIEKQDFASNFFVWMHKNCNNGCVKPINKTVFNANEAEKAFRYMTTGKHIGKIVIRIRDEESDRKPLRAVKPAVDMSVTAKTYFNPNKVYIITGGLGGIGLELVHWMLYMGAKKFILTSRQGIRTDYQKYIINRLKAFGELYKVFDSQIVVSTHDCLTIEGTKELMKQSQELGPIGGLFHLAIVLNDCLLENLTFDKFSESIDCKHKIFANLDQLSRQLSYRLDFFVIFSSIACGIGNNGQSNYAFGNSICERICEQRRADGLHGLAIQFGPIGDVGVFADSDQLLQLSSLQKQRINSCCDTLDKLLTVKQPVITSYVKVERIKSDGSRQVRMIRELWRALGIDPETTPDNLTLGEIGMESIFAVEMQQELEREYNIKMSLNHVKNITIKMLKEMEAGKVDNINKYIEDVRKARAILMKYRFLIPSETHTPLNNVKTGKPVYFLPPIEITFSAFEELAKKIDRPVIGLNWTRDMNKFETIKEINTYYLQLLDKLSPNRDYDIVAYFDSSFIASKLIRKGMVDRALILDVLSDVRLRDDSNITDDVLLEVIFGYLSHQIPEGVRDKVLREVKAEKDTNGKIRRIVYEVNDFVGKGLVMTDMEEIIHIALKRGHTLKANRQEMRKKLSKTRYNLAAKWAKKTGKLVIIKPFKFDKIAEDFDDFVEMTREAYFLPDKNDSKDKISIVCVDEVTYALASESIANTIIENLK